MKKRFYLSAFFSIALLVSTSSYANTKAIVKIPAARLREEASTKSEIVINVYEDDEVEILGEERRLVSN